MLVLQRNISESITINLEGLIQAAARCAGPDGDIVRSSILAALESQTRIIVINVAERGEGRTRIGIEAARCMTVHRTEVQRAIDDEWSANAAGKKTDEPT